MEKIEILAPAGGFDSVTAAVRSGADAVYVGSKRFSARASAKNFDSDELKRAVSYCHIHGVKVYLTPAGERRSRARRRTAEGESLRRWEASSPPSRS